MKIDAVVVLYRPSEENLRNIADYAPTVRTLYVMDNSDTPDEIPLRRLTALENVVLVPMGGNRGIAAALREGLTRAVADGADYCLTMDQDSVFPIGEWDAVKSYLSRPDADDYGVIALNINGDGSRKGLIDVRTWITSGNFINVGNYRRIDGFREELFIDSVDFDLDHQFYRIGKKIAYIGEISLRHKIGQPVQRKFLGIRTVTVTNHSPLRCYYRYRNNYLLYHEDKAFYRAIYRADKKQLVKILLFEADKREKLKMIRLGIRHAKQKKLGRLTPKETP